MELPRVGDTSKFTANYALYSQVVWLETESVSEAAVEKSVLEYGTSLPSK